MVKNLNILQRATIRNARVCANTQNSGFSVRFNKEFDTQGWVGEGVSLLGCSGGFMFMTSTSTNPSIFSSSGFAPVDSSIFTEVVVRYKYIRNRTDSTATSGILQFQTTSDSTFSEDKQEEFEVIPDGKWHQYTINMGPVSNWVGLISNLKIFFATNGQLGDEIFLTEIRIQAPSFLFCTTGCIDDTSETLVGQFFDIESLGNTPANWSLVNVDTERFITIDLDPEFRSGNGKVARLQTTSSISPGPSMLRTFQTHYSGFFSCRFRTTSSGSSGQNSGRITMITNLSSSASLWEVSLESDGFIKYKQGDVYENFETPFTYDTDTWYDLLVVYDSLENKVDIFINGDLVGFNLPVIFSGSCNAISVSYGAGEVGSFFVDDILIVQDSEINRLCPGMGVQGYATGRPVTFSYLNIIKDYNDSLIVNLDGYGDAVIKIPPQQNADPVALRLSIERAISSLDVGGYPYAEVDYSEGQFTIRSGTVEFTSSVLVKRNGDSPLAEQLGFVEGETSVFSSKGGRPHAKGFKFLNGYRATTYDLTSLVLGDSFEPIYHNPKKVSPVIGSSRAGIVGKGVSIEGGSKTLVDFYNRADSEGVVTKLRLHGVLPTTSETLSTGSEGVGRGRLFDTGVVQLSDLFREGDRSLIEGAILIIDEPGYAGNGEYIIESIYPKSNSSSFSSFIGIVMLLDSSVSLPPQENLNWSIIVVSKVKHFRPKLDGSLELINEVTLGIEESGVLYTRSHDFYEVDVDWHVIRGDLIGVYNATKLFAGNHPLQVPDALYLELEGDARGTVSFSPPEGEGIEGIGLNGFGEITEEKAIYDIDLGSAISLEALELSAREEVVELDYNILTAVNQGISVSVDTHGETHNHLPVRGSTGIAELITHSNVSYNINALTDGVKFPKNGVVGSFEQNDPRSTYFYVNGDGEWIDIEFPEPTWIQGTGEAFNFRDDPITFRYRWDYDKTIHRFVTYFKEFPNFAGYQLEYLQNPGSPLDGSEIGYRIIGGFNEEDVSYRTVTLDDRLYERDVVLSASGVRSQDSHTHIKHFEKKYDVYDKGAAMTKDEKRRFDASLYSPFRVIDKTWDSVTTKGFNLYTFFHYSTKVIETELYSKTSSESDLEDLVELFFSKDGETFHRASTVRNGEDVLRFVIGGPCRYIRITVSPFSSFSLKSLYAIPDSEQIKITHSDTGLPVTSIDIDPVRGIESPAHSVKVVNRTGLVSDLEISVDVEELWSHVLLKTTLENQGSISSPEIGPPGTIYLEEDFDLPVVSNVAINATTYGLKNLAPGKRYYITDEINTESDLFGRGIEPDKWEIQNTNFPQSNISSSPPSFRMVGEPPGSIAPTGEMSSALVSRWRVSGSFTATINCQYDSAGANADPIGSRIGIQDNSGRRIYISRERVNFSLSGNARSWADYFIRDSLVGDLTTKTIFCQSGCGTVTGNSSDNNVPYDLRIVYIREPSQGLNLLRFYYKDSLNFDGIFQWDKSYDPLFPTEDLGYELDLDSLDQPLQMPLKVFIENRWKRSSSSSLGTPSTTEGSYVKVNTFKFFGSSTYSSKASLIPGYAFVDSTGKILESNLVSDSFARSVKGVAVDLGRTYALDLNLLKIFNGDPANEERDLWNVGNTLYSNSNVSNPELVSWGNSDSHNVRWLLFQELSTEDESEEKILHSVRVYPDVTAKPDQLTSNAHWEDLGNTLTNGNYQTSLRQSDHPVIAIRLANSFAIRNYKLLSGGRTEYSSEENNPSSFTGWANLEGEFPTLFNTYGFTNTENPSKVVWRGWDTYPGLDSLDPDKGLITAKWFCFKNTLFNISNPNLNVQRVSQFVASTVGLDYSANGRIVDRVDFTEYAEWFNSTKEELIDIGLISSDQLDLDGLLYGSSELADPGFNFGDSPLGAFSLFDADPSTSLYLSTTVNGPYFYRIFGSVSGSLDFSTMTGDPTLEEGEVSVTGLTPIVTLSPEEIVRLEIYLSDNTSSVPKDLSIQILTAEDYTDEGNWVTVSGASFQDIEDRFGTFIDDSDVGVRSFETGDAYFSYDFPSPTLVRGVRVVITEFEEVGANFPVCNVSQLRILKEINSTEEALIIENDSLIRHSGRRSLKLTYPAGSSGKRTCVSADSFQLEPDEKWSIQDFLSFWMKVEGFNNIDLSQSYLRIGKNSLDYFEWAFDELSPPRTNFAEQTLRFSKARTKGGSISDYERTSDLRELLPETNFRDGPISYFEVAIVPNTQDLQSSIQIWIDDFRIKRENFTLPGKSHNCLYLTNGELVHFPLSGFDMRKGSIECIITPDWDRFGHLEIPYRELPGDQIYTIFNITNGASESMSLYYTDRRDEGLHFTINTPSGKVDLIVGQLLTLKNRYRDSVKLTLLWDNEGKRINARGGTTVRLFINDVLVGDSVETWQITETKDTYFLIGSRAYSQAASSNTRQFAEFGFNVELRPSIHSLNGGIEDLLITSNPQKVDFDNIVTLRDKVLISLDGVTYYPGNSTSLPLRVSSVPPGGEVELYIKTNLPSFTKNMPRTGFIRARWQITV